MRIGKHAQPLIRARVKELGSLQYNNPKSWQGVRTARGEGNFRLWRTVLIPSTPMLSAPASIFFLIRSAICGKACWNCAMSRWLPSQQKTHDI